MTADDRSKAALSLAMKAGRVKAGEFAVKKAFDRGEVKLLILDLEASEATKKRWRDACGYRGVPFIEMDSPGEAIGRENVITFGVVSDGFVKMILNAKK